MSSAAEATPTSPSSDLSSLRAQLVGTWKLMSAEDQQDDGSWKPGTFGTPPSGYFIYAESGYASVQIMPVPPVSVTAPDPQSGPDATQEFVSEFISYYGKWTIDETYITVQAEGNLSPSGVGQAQARHYTLDGDTLIIGSVADGYLRTLQRVR